MLQNEPNREKLFPFVKLGQVGRYSSIDLCSLKEDVLVCFKMWKIELRTRTLSRRHWKTCNVGGVQIVPIEGCLCRLCVHSRNFSLCVDIVKRGSSVPVLYQ